jgi:hypothetical protein
VTLEASQGNGRSHYPGGTRTLTAWTKGIAGRAAILTDL